MSVRLALGECIANIQPTFATVSLHNYIPNVLAIQGGEVADITAATVGPGAPNRSNKSNDGLGPHRGPGFVDPIVL